ncbi:hypothetical protein ACROYT_G042114, partial [Oculina patagonica]
MPEETNEAQRPESAKCSKTFFASALVVAFFCFSASVAIVIFVILFVKVCAVVSNTDITDLVGILSFLAVILFMIGALTLIVSRDLRRRYNRSAPQIPEVIISPIPEEDLEKSPAPDLNIRPRRHPSVVDLQGIELPDYFTAVQNINEAYSFEDVPDEMSLPTYEQAFGSTTEQIFVTLAS